MVSPASKTKTKLYPSTAVLNVSPENDEPASPPSLMPASPRDSASCTSLVTSGSQVLNEDNPSRDSFEDRQQKVVAQKQFPLCQKCSHHQVAVVFLPCNHMVTCADCARNVQECPHCERAIVQKLVMCEETCTVNDTAVKTLRFRPL